MLSHGAAAATDLQEEFRMNTVRRVVCAAGRLACLVAIGVGMLPASSRAAGTVGDGTAASCTEAALDAALIGGGEVHFNCGADGKIQLTHAKQITAKTTIGTDHAVILSGESGTRLFEIASTGELILRNLVLERGVPASGDGGAIHNRGKLLLLNTRIRSSVVDDTHRGGAIFSSGPVTLDGCGLESNRAGYGAAIYVDGSATLRAVRTIAQGNVAAEDGGVYAFGPATNGTITDGSMIANEAKQGGVVYAAVGAHVNVLGNPTPPDQPSALILEGNQAHGLGGAAIYNDGGQVLIDHAVLRMNTTLGWGGAVFSTGVLRVFNSQILGNKSRFPGGGLSVSSHATVQGVTEVKNSVLLGNHAIRGGAIDHNGMPLKISRSALIANHVSGGVGGALFTQGSQGKPTVRLENVTISENSVDSQLGGGIYNAEATVSLSSCTITDNTNGVFTALGTTRFRNTVVQNDGYLNCDGDGTPVVDDSHNFSTDNSCAFTSSTSGGIDAKLAPLDFDPVHVTYFREPRAGSPLIDAGAACPALDQREAARVGVCDIGSVEFGH